MTDEGPARVLITAAAADLLGTLQDRHGPLMFHQSGGCCDGSSPMCYPDGEFIVGDRDVLLGVVQGAAVWISGSQFQTWKHTQLTLDVGAGEPEGFSIGAGDDRHFVIRSRVFDDDELKVLDQSVS